MEETEKHSEDNLELGTIREACEIVGGKGKPINPATYYRGVAAGRFVKPVKLGPNIARVDLRKLREKIRSIVDARTDDCEA